MQQGQDQRGHVRDIKALTVAPELRGRQHAIAGRQKGIHHDAHRHVVIERRNQAEHQPDACAGNDSRHRRRAPDQYAHGGPVHCRAKQQGHVAENQRNKINPATAPADQYHTQGGEQHHCTQISQRPLAGFAPPGMTGQQTHQNENEDRDYQQGRDVQIHCVNSR
ncbi:hypothetical protein D3C76_1305670 [compost metagenome]